MCFQAVWNDVYCVKAGYIAPPLAKACLPLSAFPQTECF